MTKISVKTAWLEQTPDLLEDLGNSTVFLREGRLLVGKGEALRISARGKDRIQSLSKAWLKLVAEAQISDEVQLPGSGLVAFCSIAFSENSEFESVLIVPQELVVIRNDRAWKTTFEPTAPSIASANGVAGKEFIQGEMTSALFRQAVEQSISKIRSSELEKVVLARDLVMPIEGRPNLHKVLHRLHSRYPHCWTYFVNDNFGASPELLIRSSAGEVSARVLAGTAARGTDPDVDRAISEGLLHSTKNQHEHQFAVDSLIRKLEPFCDAVEADSKPFSLALPDLFHLATDVRGHLKETTTLLDVVAHLHPTAAVAGTPREKALELIEELEPFDRGGYAGPVGWIAADGSGELAIALRGGRIEKNQIRAFAGCGIVSESEPQAELDETELKFKAVRWAFEN